MLTSPKSMPVVVVVPRRQASKVSQVRKGWPA
jgi:hypothetical protein